MPPKTGPVDADGGAAITVLCHLLVACPEFRADMNQLAPILGIASGKNVPRKINSIVTPYGFEFKGGKMVVADGADVAPATPRKAITKDTGSDSPKTPKVPKSASKSASAKSTKKRKFEVIEDVGSAMDDDDPDVKPEGDMSVKPEKEVTIKPERATKGHSVSWSDMAPGEEDNKAEEA